MTTLTPAQAGSAKTILDITEGVTPLAIKAQKFANDGKSLNQYWQGYSKALEDVVLIMKEVLREHVGE